jgi:hypothetical protein
MSYHVHAHLSAVVSAGEPVPSGVPQDQLIAGPRHPVALLVKVKMSDWKVDNNLLNIRISSDAMIKIIYFPLLLFKRTIFTTYLKVEFYF